MDNKFEIRGEDTAIFIKRPDGTFLETIIDTSDLPLMDSFKGVLRASRYDMYSQYYVYGPIEHYSDKRKRTVKKQVSLHRFLMDFPKYMVVDHINEDTLNNKRSKNLQVITNGENVKKSSHRRNRVERQQLITSRIGGKVTADQKKEIMFRAHELGMSYEYWIAMIISKELNSTPWYEITDLYSDKRRVQKGYNPLRIGASVESLKQVD
jgi:hypothetical protein